MKIRPVPRGGFIYQGEKEENGWQKKGRVAGCLRENCPCRDVLVRGDVSAQMCCAFRVTGTFCVA